MLECRAELGQPMGISPEGSPTLRKFAWSAGQREVLRILGALTAPRHCARDAMKGLTSVLSTGYPFTEKL